MSEDLEAHFRLRVSGQSELGDAFSQGERAAQRFSAATNRYLQSAGAALSAFGGRAKSELSAFGGKELGGSLGSEARGVLQLRDAINQLAVSSGGGNEMMAGLTHQIHAVSVASNQLQGNVTDALQAFVERTGNIEIARRNLELYAKTATATSASLEDVARVGESLFSKFKITDQKQSFDILATQAKSGAIELRDIATQGASVFAAARAGGLPANEQGVREIGALLQTVAGGARGKGKTTAADTAVQVNAIFSQIRQKAGQLEGIGIKVDGRDQIDVLKEIIVKAKGDPRKLQEVFKNIRAFRGVEELARDYRETGSFTQFDKYLNLGADPTVLDRDFKTRTSTGDSKIKANKIARDRFYEQYLGGLAEFGAEHATGLQLGAYGLDYAGKGLGLLGRTGGALGGRVGQAIGSATAQRVFVVNWPAGGLGGAPGGSPQIPGWAGKALKATGVGIAAYELTSAVDDLTGGRITGGTASLLGWLSGQKGKLAGVEGAGADLNQVQLERRRHRRDALVQDFELKGLAHGAALNAADQQLKAEIKQINVTINGNEATADVDGGTRSPKVMVRRGADSSELD